MRFTRADGSCCARKTCRIIAPVEGAHHDKQWKFRRRPAGRACGLGPSAFAQSDAFTSTENPLWQQVYADSVLPTVESGQALLVEDGHEVDGTFTLEATASGCASTTIGPT